MKSTAQNYTITSTSKKSCLEHSLQKHCLIHQLSNTKKETYNISTILNGRLSSEGIGCPVQRRAAHQGKENWNNTRETVKPESERHKILVIGDSHVTGLSKNISNCLDDSFSVFGTTKPNADIETITPPIHLKTGNITKED